MPTEILKKSIVAEIETVLTTKGAEDAKKTLSEYAKIIEEAKKKIKGFQDEADKNEDKAKKLIQSNFNIAQSFGQVGQHISRVNPILGYITEKFGQVAQSIVDFSKKSIEGAKGFGLSLARLAGPLGIVATAAGAIVASTLGSFFTRTGEGADYLAVKLAGISAGFGNILDNLAVVGKLFLEGKFKEALNFNILQGTDDAKALGGALQARKNILENSQRDARLTLQNLETQKQKSLEIISEEKKSLEDFAKAKQALGVFDKANIESLKIRLGLLGEELSIENAKNTKKKLKGLDLTKDEKDRISDLKVAIAKLDEELSSADTKSNRIFNRLTSGEDALREQRANELKETKKKNAEILDEIDRFNKEFARAQEDFTLGNLIPKEGFKDDKHRVEIRRKIEDLIETFRDEVKKLKGEGVNFEIDPNIKITEFEENLISLFAQTKFEVNLEISEKSKENFDKFFKFVQKRRKEEEEKEKAEIERRKKIKDDSVTAIQNIKDIASTFIDAEIQKTDTLISEQQRRIDGVKEIANKGNAEQLQLEEERLNKLLQRREAAVRRQEALNKIEVASQTAVSIANLIGSILKEAGTKNIYSAIFGGIALVATIASLVASLKGSQGFAEGTEFVKGKGTSKSDSIHARLSVGERVVPEHINKLLRGVRNNELPHYVNIGKMVAESNKSKAVYPKNANVSDANLLNRVLELAESNNKKVDDLQVYVQFDETSLVVRNERRSKHEVIKQRLIR